MNGRETIEFVLSKNAALLKHLNKDQRAKLVQKLREHHNKTTVSPQQQPHQREPSGVNGEKEEHKRNTSGKHVGEETCGRETFGVNGGEEEHKRKIPDKNGGEETCERESFGVNGEHAQKRKAPEKNGGKGTRRRETFGVNDGKEEHMRTASIKNGGEETRGRETYGKIGGENQQQSFRSTIAIGGEIENAHRRKPSTGAGGNNEQQQLQMAKTSLDGENRPQSQTQRRETTDYNGARVSTTTGDVKSAISDRNTDRISLSNKRRYDVSDVIPLESCNGRPQNGSHDNVDGDKINQLITSVAPTDQKREPPSSRTSTKVNSGSKSRNSDCMAIPSVGPIKRSHRLSSASTNKSSGPKLNDIDLEPIASVTPAAKRDSMSSSASSGGFSGLKCWTSKPIASVTSADQSQRSSSRNSAKSNITAELSSSNSLDCLTDMIEEIFNSRPILSQNKSNSGSRGSGGGGSGGSGGSGGISGGRGISECNSGDGAARDEVINSESGTSFTVNRTATEINGNRKPDPDMFSTSLASLDRRKRQIIDLDEAMSCGDENKRSRSTASSSLVDQRKPITCDGRTSLQNIDKQTKLKSKPTSVSPSRKSRDCSLWVRSSPPARKSRSNCPNSDMSLSSVSSSSDRSHRSQSPQCRSNVPTPIRRSRSPQRQSHSTRRSSRSLRRPSLRRLSHSPYRHSHSPQRQTRYLHRISPRRRSPHRQSHSPRRQSHLRRRSSPTVGYRRELSPSCSSPTPRRRSRSPHRISPASSYRRQLSAPHHLRSRKRNQHSPSPDQRHQSPRSLRKSPIGCSSASGDQKSFVPKSFSDDSHSSTASGEDTTASAPTTAPKTCSLKSNAAQKLLNKVAGRLSKVAAAEKATAAAKSNSNASVAVEEAASAVVIEGASTVVKEGAPVVVEEADSTVVKYDATGAVKEVASALETSNFIPPLPNHDPPSAAPPLPTVELCSTNLQYFEQQQPRQQQFPIFTSVPPPTGPYGFGAPLHNVPTFFPSTCGITSPWQQQQLHYMQYSLNQTASSSFATQDACYTNDSEDGFKVIQSFNSQLPSCGIAFEPLPPGVESTSGSIGSPKEQQIQAKLAKITAWDQATVNSFVEVNLQCIMQKEHVSQQPWVNDEVSGLYWTYLQHRQLKFKCTAPRDGAVFNQLRVAMNAALITFLMAAMRRKTGFLFGQCLEKELKSVGVEVTAFGGRVERIAAALDARLRAVLRSVCVGEVKHNDEQMRAILLPVVAAYFNIPEIIRRLLTPATTESTGSNKPILKQKQQNSTNVGAKASAHPPPGEHPKQVPDKPHQHLNIVSWNQSKVDNLIEQAISFVVTKDVFHSQPWADQELADLFLEYTMRRDSLNRINSLSPYYTAKSNEMRTAMSRFLVAKDRRKTVFFFGRCLESEFRRIGLESVSEVKRTRSEVNKHDVETGLKCEQEEKENGGLELDASPNEMNAKHDIETFAKESQEDQFSAGDQTKRGGLGSFSMQIDEACAVLDHRLRAEFKPFADGQQEATRNTTHRILMSVMQEYFNIPETIRKLVGLDASHVPSQLEDPAEMPIVGQRPREREIVGFETTRALDRLEVSDAVPTDKQPQEREASEWDVPDAIPTYKQPNVVVPSAEKIKPHETETGFQAPQATGHLDISVSIPTDKQPQERKPEELESSDVSDERADKLPQEDEEEEFDSSKLSDEMANEQPQEKGTIELDSSEVSCEVADVPPQEAERDEFGVAGAMAVKQPQERATAELNSSKMSGERADKQPQEMETTEFDSLEVSDEMADIQPQDMETAKLESSEVSSKMGEQPQERETAALDSSKVASEMGQQPQGRETPEFGSLEMVGELDDIQPHEKRIVGLDPSEVSGEVADKEPQGEETESSMELCQFGVPETMTSSKQPHEREALETTIQSKVPETTMIDELALPQERGMQRKVSESDLAQDTTQSQDIVQWLTGIPRRFLPDLEPSAPSPPYDDSELIQLRGRWLGYVEAIGDQFDGVVTAQPPVKCRRRALAILRQYQMAKLRKLTVSQLRFMCESNRCDPGTIDACASQLDSSLQNSFDALDNVEFEAVGADPEPLAGVKWLRALNDRCATEIRQALRDPLFRTSCGAIITEDVEASVMAAIEAEQSVECGRNPDSDNGNTIFDKMETSNKMLI